jgi:hypothetical protein
MVRHSIRKSTNKTPWRESQKKLTVTFSAECVVFACFQPLSDLLQMTCSSHTRWFLTLSPNWALRLVKVSADVTFSLVRNLKIMRHATVEWTTCSLIVITTDKKSGRQVAIWYNGYSIPSLTVNKVILFYSGISAFERKNSGFYLNRPLTYDM